MFCQNCGTQNSDGVKFCNNCGAPLQAASEETTVLNQPSVQPAQQYAPVSPGPQKPKSSKKTGLIIGGVAGAIVLIVAVVLIVVFAGKGKDNKPANADNESKTSVSEVQNTKKQDEPTSPAQTSMSRDEVAIAYMKALANLDFAEADKYCILDLSEVYETYAKNNGVNIDELYNELSKSFNGDFFRELNGEEVEINSMSDLYSAFEKVLRNEIPTDELAKLMEEIEKDEIESTKKLDLNDDSDKDDLIDDIVSCDPFGLISHSNYTDFIKLGDITEAYEIEFTDGSWFFVVMYKGEWRVVANAITAFV